MTKHFWIVVTLASLLSCGSSNKVQIIVSGITDATVTTKSLISGKTLSQRRVNFSKDRLFGFAELGLGLEPIRIEITNATYIDDGGDAFQFEDSQMWSASFAEIETNSTININLLTTLADAWMDWNISGTADFQERISNADQLIAEQVGLMSLQNNLPTFEFESQSINESIKYGLLLKGLEEAAKSLDWNVPDLVHQLSLDIRTNGKIDSSGSEYLIIEDRLYDDQILKARLAGGVYGFYKKKNGNLSESLVESFVNQVSLKHSDLFDVNVQDFEFEKNPPETIVVNDIPSGFVVGLADVNIEVMDSLSNPASVRVSVISSSDERVQLTNDLPNPSHFVSTISTTSLPAGPSTIEVVAQDLFSNQSIWEYPVEF